MGLFAEVHNLSAFRCGQLFVGLAGYLCASVPAKIEFAPIFYVLHAVRSLQTLLVASIDVEGDGDFNDKMPSDGVIESQLVWSRDGVNWRHADEARTPAIPRSQPGQGFDSGIIIGALSSIELLLMPCRLSLHGRAARHLQPHRQTELANGTFLLSVICGPVQGQQRSQCRMRLLASTTGITQAGR